MTPSTDPVKRPTVKLGDKEYPLKFRLSDLSNLNKEHGIDLFTPAKLTGIAAVERVAKVLSAGIAHTGEGLSPDQIMECIELGELPIFALAIVEAQKKVSDEAAKASRALEAMAPKVKQSDPSIQ
jgi:hypothetical protein